MLRLRSSIVLAGCFLAALGYSHLWENHRYLHQSNLLLRQWADNQPQPTESQFETLRWRLKLKAYKYNQLIENNHLVDGMVVNLKHGKPVDQCDSLLFSSLRYASLKKMGFGYAAARAWRGIENAHIEGEWRRHPTCADLATSKDMIMGLLVALSQRPRDHRKVIRGLFDNIRQKGGYFGEGPLYLSYTTPTLGNQLRSIGRRFGIEYGQMPDQVRAGFSTSEFSHYFVDGGFKSHLISLATLLSLESSNRQQLSQVDQAPAISMQLVDWNTYQLVTENQNLFNRYLKLRAAGALNTATRFALMQALAQMETQFPSDYLPRNCDRKADYLWQRNIAESYQRTNKCSATFNGVDFLWMAALLTDTPEYQLNAAH